jgi:tetratricopeptide (TPR) repeat protein
MRFRAAIVYCLVAVLTLPSIAMAERETIIIEKQGAPANDAQLRQRVTLMRSRVDDENVQFSGTDAMEELKVLRAHVGKRQDLIEERRDILSMIGLVTSRSSVVPFEDGIDALTELMTLADDDRRPLKRQLGDRYLYAELLGGYAKIPGNSASHALSAEQYGKAALMADRYDGYSDDQRAGVRQKQAYELHEAKLYEQAYTLNLDVLARGEKIFGKSHPNLTTVLTNLAQNLHAMGRKQEAEPYLARVLAIAEADNDLDTVQDLLFQRGVLAYELGRKEDAKAFMQTRIERLRAAGEDARLATAQEDYDELLRRLGE